MDISRMISAVRAPFANSAGIAIISIVATEVMASLAGLLQVGSGRTELADADLLHPGEAFRKRDQAKPNRRRQPRRDRRAAKSAIAGQWDSGRQYDRRKARGRRAADWGEMKLPLLQ